MGAIGVVYVPQQRELEEIQEQIASQDLAISVDSEKASGLPRMIKKIEALKRRYQGFDRRLPQRKELGGFLKEISSVLASERLQNQSTEPGNPKREDQFHTLPIIMKFQGSYLSLASLLERIDRMERLTRVQKLSVVTDPKSDELKIEIQLNIYFKES